jgi:hypothetical protein
MRQKPNVFTIRAWRFDPKRRAHRFRCQGCAKLIADGSDVVLEKRGRSSHGYHAECFTGLAAEAALARDDERLKRKE